MWTIILAGFCIGVINVSQPAPVYKVTVEKIEDGLLKFDVNEICKDAGYVRAKRDDSPMSPDRTTLLNDSLLKNSDYSTTTESPSATVRINVTAIETEADETVIAVNRTAKESDHNATMPTDSDDDETVTLKSVTVTESDHEVTTENVTILMVKNITNLGTVPGGNKSNPDAIMLSDNATVMDTETEADETVIAVNRTAKESDHNATMPTDSDDDETVTLKSVTVTESDHEVTTENVTILMVKNITNLGTVPGGNKSNQDAIMISDNATVMDSDHKINRTTENVTVTDQKVITKVKNVTATRSSHNVTVLAENFSDPGTMTTDNATITDSDRNGIMTAGNVTVMDNSHGVNLTAKNVTAPRNGHDVSVTPQNDTGSSVTGGIKGNHDVNVTLTNDTASDHDTNRTIKKVKHDKTDTTVNDMADGTENKHDKTVTVKNSTVNSSEHDVAPNPVDTENTDTAAQSTGAKPVVSAHDKSATSMSVLGILLISLVIAGVLIGISHVVYKIHKANSYVLPPRNVPDPEATPLNHISR